MRKEMPMPTDWLGWLERVASLPRFEGDYSAGEGPGVWSVYVTDWTEDGSAASDAAEQIATVIDKDTAEYLAHCARLIPELLAAFRRGELLVAGQAEGTEGGS